MSNSSTSTKYRSTPLSIRFTDAEKAVLQEKAGGMPLGTFIKGVVLSDSTKRRPDRSSYPVRNGEALGQLLGLLGQSRIANNLNQLAKAANLGALPVVKETEDDIRQACAAVLEMRQLLLLALGARIIDQVKDAPSLRGVFAGSAGAPRQ